MAFPQGVNFRSTSGYVTDPANHTYQVALTPDYPTTSPQGNNIGWTAFPTAGTRDRNSGNDARLAGENFDSAGVYRIDLPAPGSYTVFLACGDATYAQSNQKIELFDDVTSLGVLFTGAATGAANSFLDATGVARTAANWPSQNVGVTNVYASTKCIVKIGDGSNNTAIATLFVQSAGPPILGPALQMISTGMRW